jgi:hypothetical protein
MIISVDDGSRKFKLENVRKNYTESDQIKSNRIVEETSPMVNKRIGFNFTLQCNGSARRSSYFSNHRCNSDQYEEEDVNNPVFNFGLK